MVYVMIHKTSFALQSRALRFEASGEAMATNKSCALPVSASRVSQPAELVSIEPCGKSTLAGTVRINSRANEMSETTSSDSVRR